MTAAGDVGVRRGDQEPAGSTARTRKKLLERVDGLRAHAAGGRGIQRVGTAPLDRRQTQRVDRSPRTPRRGAGGRSHPAGETAG